MKFQEISDKQWETIQNHLPSPARTGRPRCDDRTTINGIMFVLVTGCRWGEMPKYDGVYALQRIRKANPKAKVIMITADLKKDAAQRLEDLKPDRIIFKPFDYGKIVMP